MDFCELEHFLDYLPPKRDMKTRNKADRRRKANKPPLFHVNVNVVKMEESDNGFALLCEAYSQSMSTNYPYYNNNTYSPYNSAFYNPYYGFSPYAYNPMMMNRYYYSPYGPYGNPRNY